MNAEARFNELFDEHFPAVSRYLHSQGHQPADAEDLIAATFEVAWRRLDRVPRGREAVPWLITTARNLSRNAQRKSQRELIFVQELARQTRRASEDAADGRAEAARALAAVAELKPVDRELILLIVWHQLTPTEAGEVLGLRAVTARSRLHRARRRLAELLAEPATSRPADINLITSTIKLEGPHDT